MAKLQDDGSLEDEVGGAGEGDILEGIPLAFEADGHGVATLYFDEDGGGGVMEGVMDEGGGDNAGAAGEGLVLDAPLVSSHDEGAIGADLGEVGVGAFGGEVFVVAKGGPEGAHIGVGEVGAEDDGVGDTGVDEVDRERFPGGGEV